MPARTVRVISNDNRTLGYVIGLATNNPEDIVEVFWDHGGSGPCRLSDLTITRTV